MRLEPGWARSKPPAQPIELQLIDMIGKDHMLGMGEHYILSDDMVIIIHSKGMHYLTQVWKSMENGSRVKGWKCAQNLGLEDPLKWEWEAYIGLLIQFGLSLTDKRDLLFW